MNSTHSYIDLGITFCSIVIGNCIVKINLLHIHLPPIVMEVTAEIAWGVGILAGMLTVLNFLGYTPKWLQKIKNKIKNT